MKRKLTLLSFAFMLSALVVGCVKEDPKPKPKPEENYAEKLAGTFKGDATYGSEATAVTTKSVIKATAVNVVEITVKDYQFNATTKSDLVIAGVKIELADEKNLSLSGNAQATVGGQSVDVALTGSALVGGESVKFDISVAGFNGVKYSGSRYTNAVGAELMSPVVSGICVISSEFDAAKGIVTYTVPTHARETDLAAIEATFTISDGASWVMKNDTKASEAQKLNLTKAETTIEVTAENGDKKSYTFKREAVNVDDASIALINTYEGDLNVVVGGTPAPAVENQIVSVTRTASNLVNLSITDFTFMEINIGTIVIDNVALYKGTTSVVLAGDGKVKINLGAGEIEVDVKISGSYVLAEKKLALSLAIVVDPALTVTATYEGTPLVDPIATKPLFISATHANILQQKFDGGLTFYVDAKYPDADYANLKVDIRLPEGATWKVTSTEEFDFTKKAQWFTVTAADGKTTENYCITRAPLTFVNQKLFSFTDWKETDQSASGISNNSAPVGWQTPNDAVVIIKAFSQGTWYPNDAPYPVSPLDAGKEGKAATLMTLDTKGGLLFGNIAVPKVTAGTIYTGVFNMEAAMKDALMATEFGLHYNGAKPTQVKGWYTYTPGAKYFDYNGTVWTETSTVDQPSVSVVLYDVTDDVNATITGKDTYTSPRIVAQGMINPAKATSFTEFTVDLTYTKEYTPATRVYKLAYIMSASKDGALFKGAPGSTFVVDELTLVTE